MAISTNKVDLSSVFTAVMERGIHNNNKREAESLMGEITTLIEKMVEIQKRDPYAFQGKKRMCATIKFKKEECAEMETAFKKEFVHGGYVAHIVKYDNEDGTYLYEIRHRRNGYNILSSSADLKEAKQKFIEMTKPENIGKYTVWAKENIKLGA